MAGVQTRNVKPDEAELRLDRWFKRHFPALKHGRLEKLLRTGQVRVDGKRAEAGTRLEAGQVIRIPEGHYFTLGDNLDGSSDSRYWGLVPEKNIVGKAFLVWWNFSDLSRIGLSIE